MRRLVRHIEQALYTHECVVVPTIGAFIRQARPAHLDESKGLIYPGNADITFSPSLVHNDGILQEQYRRLFALSQKRALRMLEGDVEELREKLSSSSVVNLGSVGRLSYTASEGGRYTFFPNPDHPFSIAQYGLSSVARLPKIDTSEGIGGRHSAVRSDAFYHLTIPKKTLKYGAAAVLVLGLGLFVPSTRILDFGGSRAYEAGFFTALQAPTPKTTSAQVAPSPTDSSEPLSVQAPSAPLPLSQEDTIAGVRVDFSASSDKPYYVVVATFESRRRVEKFLEQTSLEGLKVLSTGRQYRVYSDHFSTKEAAESHRQELGATHRAYSDAWVYRTRE